MSASRTSGLASLAVLAVLVGCEPGPAEPSLVQTGELQIHAAVNVPTISTIVVQVSAPDLSQPLVFNLELVGGVASGKLVVPAGSDRTITVRAYDASGTETHEGHVTVDVKPGPNPTVHITLRPRQGDQPIEIVVGSFAITVQPAEASLAEGATLQMEATVTDGEGRVVGGADDVVWATDAPAVATVNAAGLVTARQAGNARIIASFGGVAAAGEITVQDGQSTAAGITVRVTARGPDVGLSSVCVWDVIDAYCVYESVYYGQPIFGDGYVTQVAEFTLSPGGTYAVSIGPPGNCTVPEPPPSTVFTLAPGEWIDLAFELTCVALGNLRVTATVNGADGTGTWIEVCLDTYDYDSEACPAFYAGGVPLTIQGLVPGTHTVWWLNAEASPCTIVGHGQLVNVPSGGTAEARFEINCTTAP